MTLTYSANGYTGVLKDGELTIYQHGEEVLYLPYTAIRSQFELNEQIDHIEERLLQAEEQAGRERREIST